MRSTGSTKRRLGHENYADTTLAKIINQLTAHSLTLIHTQPIAERDAPERVVEKL